MTAPHSRIARRFEALRSEGRAGLVAFVTAGDPDDETSSAILAGLPGAGADLIEIGMPFSDPMADGPAIQAANQRALANGQTLTRTLAMAADLRARDADIPLVLMGYFTPIYRFGTSAFLDRAGDAGIDGLIVVDLPLEEEQELRPSGDAGGIEIIRLVTPAAGPRRLDELVANSKGFLYYVSVAGVTGTKSAAVEDTAAGVGRIRDLTELPVAVGFGIATPAQAAEVARVADAVVVGSAIVQRIAAGLDDRGRPGTGLVDDVLGLVKELSLGVRGARKRPATRVETV